MRSAAPGAGWSTNPPGHPSIAKLLIGGDREGFPSQNVIRSRSVPASSLPQFKRRSASTSRACPIFSAVFWKYQTAECSAASASGRSRFHAASPRSLPSRFSISSTLARAPVSSAISACGILKVHASVHLVLHESPPDHTRSGPSSFFSSKQAVARGEIAGAARSSAKASWSICERERSSVADARAQGEVSVRPAIRADRRDSIGLGHREVVAEGRALSGQPGEGIRELRGGSDREQENKYGAVPLCSGRSGGSCARGPENAKMRAGITSTQRTTDGSGARTAARIASQAAVLRKRQSVTSAGISAARKIGPGRACSACRRPAAP